MSNPTISTVAALAGVSIATVSRYLNEPDKVKTATRERIQKAIQKLQYSPNTLAQSFRRGRTNVIMVVMPSVGDPFLADVLSGIREEIGTRYSLLIAEADLKHRTYEEVGAMFVSRQVDGLILLATLPPFGTKLDDISRDQRLPVVVGCESISHELKGLPSVHIDNFQAAFEATSYLTDLGHERIAFFSGPTDSLLTQDRERGYREAMAARNLPVEEDWVSSTTLTIGGGALAAKRLLSLPERPSAIFCANDEMALGVLDTLRTRKIKVPSEMSLIGFDDSRYAAVANPPLSTVAQPAAEIGRRVALRILREIEGSSEPAPLDDLLQHRLVIRQSTGRAPGR